MKQQWTGERLETDIHGQAAVEHFHRYALAAEYCRGKTVLDLACGEGYGALLLAGTASRVTAIDVNAEIIDRARKKYPRPHLHFNQGAVEALPVEDHVFDIVVSFETLEHTDHQEQMMTEIRRVLKPEGLLIISTPDKKWYSDATGYHNPFHRKELYGHEFDGLLSRHFKNVSRLRQKFLNGSVILPAASSSPALFYRGNAETIFRTEEMEAPYIVAFASDEPIPSVRASFFAAGDVMDLALRTMERQLKQSATYRLGNFLLGPVKWIKRLAAKS